MSAWPLLVLWVKLVYEVIHGLASALQTGTFSLSELMPQPHPHTAGPTKSLLSSLLPLSPWDPTKFRFSRQSPLCLLQSMRQVSGPGDFEK